MSINNPELQTVTPVGSGVVLRQPIVMTFVGPSLIDPRSFSSNTFAIYGPGDVVYDTGPGTILNSGIVDSPYTLIDGAVIREQVAGEYELYLSGVSGYSELHASGNIGVSGTKVTCLFTVNQPLSPNTIYEAVLVGDDLASGYLEGSGRYLGIQSWTSESYFTQSGTVSSGTLGVQSSYDRILPTTIYDSSTGYNDTYTVTITSGSDFGAPKFSWGKASVGGTYPGEGAGIHDLGDNLTVQFSGQSIVGQEYTLDTYVPKPLTTTYSWKFLTSELDSSVPPTIPTPESVVFDNTAAGEILISPISSTQEALKPLDTFPENYEYAVISGLQLVVFKFNKVLKPWLVTSGIITTTDFPLTITPLAGMPNITMNEGTIYPNLVEISGVYLKLWI